MLYLLDPIQICYLSWLFVCELACLYAWSIPFIESYNETISPTDFILGTKVQPNKAHSMTQVSMTLTWGQGQRSRSIFSQNGLNTKQLATSLILFHPQTHKLHHTYYHSFLWLNWALPSCLIYIVVTHLGVALLLWHFTSS